MNFDSTTLLRMASIWLVLSVLLWFYGKSLAGLDKRIVFGFIARLLPVWLFGVLVLARHGQTAFGLILSFFIPLAERFQSKYTITLQPLGDSSHISLLFAHLYRDLPPIKAPSDFVAPIDNLYLVIPLALLTGLLCAWPVRRFRERALLVASAPLLIAVFLLLTYPFHLSAQFEQIFQTISYTTGVERPKPLGYLWSRFLDEGGRWLLILFLALCAKACVIRIEKKL